MKRPAKKQRDRELETLKSMTTVSLSRDDVRDRLLADKAALETRLREVFRINHQLKDDIGVAATSYKSFRAELIKSISAELRNVKARLK